MSSAPTGVRVRSRVEAVLAVVSATVTVLTAIRPDWLEAVGIAPDRGHGTAEWLIVAGLAVVTLTLATLARLEWRRTVTASP